MGEQDSGEPWSRKSRVDAKRCFSEKVYMNDVARKMVRNKATMSSTQEQKSRRVDSAA
jgi:hypothetical protein